MKQKFFTLSLLFMFFLFTGNELKAQYTTSKERKKVLKAWHHGKRKRKKLDGYNPYIDNDTNKSKHLSSKKEARENRKTERQQKRLIKRQKRKLRREGKGYKN